MERSCFWGPYGPSRFRSLAGGLLLFLSLAYLGAPRAQEAASRLMIEGREVLVHTVAKGESLYAISRKYGVSQSDIAAFNPDIHFGLKVGQKLRVPVSGSGRGADSSGYEIHVVRAGETLYQISRLYSVPVETLRQENHLRSDTLRLNATLRIPTRRGPVAAQEVIHQVAKGEGLYAIARRYGVTPDDLVRENAFLRERTPRVGDALRIVCRPPEVGPDGAPHESCDSARGEDPARLCEMAQPFPKGEMLELALVLPFSVGQRVESHDDDMGDGGTAAESAGADPRFLSFYHGALLAVEQQQLQGRSIRVRVFDTRRDAARMRQIVESDSLRNAHLIVGPVYPENVMLASSYAGQRRITLVSPLSGKTPSLAMNPFLYQANPSLMTQLREVVASLSLDEVGRVVILREEGGSERDLCDRVLSLLMERLTARGLDAGLVRSVSFSHGKSALQSRNMLKAHMVVEKPNVVIIPSSSEAFLGEVLGLLNSITLSKHYTVRVYGMAKWLRLPKLDMDELTNLSATIFTPFHVDYDREEVRQFVDTYRATYRSEPSQYAFQGYDVVSYFLTAIYQHGVDFRFCLDRLSVPLLQTELHFEQSNDFGSYESTGIYLLRFTEGAGLEVRAVGTGKE